MRPKNGKVYRGKEALERRKVQVDFEISTGYASDDEIFCHVANTINTALDEQQRVFGGYDNMLHNVHNVR